MVLLPLTRLQRCARWLALSAVVAGCSGADRSAGPVVRLSDSAVGAQAFVANCGSCHASLDGYDLARFGFSDTAIIRRAVRHVDSATARRIVTYIRSLGVAPLPRDTALFQPGSTVAADDRDFWVRLFGRDTFPATLTAAQLLAIDPRTVALPFKVMPWSDETTADDWMPDVALPASLVAANGNALSNAIAAYGHDRTTGRLVTVLAAFQSALAASGSCLGEIAAPAQPDACFQSRRWMASFAALHTLRTGNPPPIEATDLWWDTGEAAVGAYFARDALPQRPITPAAWLTLAYSFAPARNAEDGGYLGQFVQQAGYGRVALFAALRRMVDPGQARPPAVPAHQFYDALLAQERAPDAMKVDALTWAYNWLDGWLSSVASLDAATREAATTNTNNAHLYLLASRRYSTFVETPARLAALDAARDRVVAHIAALP